MMQGYKTYLIAFLMIILSGAKAQGYITDEMYATIISLLAPMGLVTLRMSMGK